MLHDNHKSFSVVRPLVVKHHNNITNDNNINKKKQINQCGLGKSRWMCRKCKVSCSGPCRMLDDFGHEMDNTHSRLDNVMKKLAKVSHMTSGNLTSNTWSHVSVSIGAATIENNWSTKVSLEIWLILCFKSYQYWPGIKNTGVKINNSSSICQVSSYVELDVLTENVLYLYRSISVVVCSYWFRV